MKKLVIIAVFAILWFSMQADAQTWEDITGGIADKEFLSVAQGEATGSMYAGTERGLYKRPSGNGGWREIFSCRGQYKGINDICITENGGLFIATRNGAYKSNIEGRNWSRFFKGTGRQNDCTRIIKASSGDGAFYLGTRGGMFYKRPDTGWKRFIGILGTGDIEAFALLEGASGRYLFIICNNDLYRFSEDDGSVQKIFIADTIEIPEESTEGESRETEDVFLLREVRTAKGSVYLATSQGIFKSENLGREFSRFNDSGLRTLKINDVLLTESGAFFAATEAGVFRYDDKEEYWFSVYSGTTGLKARRLAQAASGVVIAVFDNRLYLLRENNKLSPEEAFLSFNDEPTILKVQEAAIRYAEVSPEKIKRWRLGAQIKAFLPKLSIGIDKSASDTYEIYTSTTTSYWMYGPRDNTEGWDMNMSWDLSELIWNPDQTSIDVRSKLMVQLRDDILDEVTRIYFERRRLQVELAAGEKGTEMSLSGVNRRLRIDELTANLDAYTGGWFSKALQGGKYR